MKDSGDPKGSLLAGIEVLDPVLAPHGFVFSLETHGKGSGGWFASAAIAGANANWNYMFVFH